MYWRFTFRVSLPVSNDYVTRWLNAHPLKRTITVRQSGKVSAPLTYGVFHPVILMPVHTDWEDEQQLSYILQHEYMHIRRNDAAMKLTVALALCIHWFNPAAWLLYSMSSRDMELSCDECVLQWSGEDSREAYALALIRMEERKSGLAPFCYFSKNAMEERITAIMKPMITT